MQNKPKFDKDCKVYTLAALAKVFVPFVCDDVIKFGRISEMRTLQQEISKEYSWIEPYE
jgi:hypothetical protein